MILNVVLCLVQIETAEGDRSVQLFPAYFICQRHLFSCADSSGYQVWQAGYKVALLALKYINSQWGSFLPVWYFPATLYNPQVRVGVPHGHSAYSYSAVTLWLT